ncbi:MAG: ribosomal RNA small subunit methyltransferase H [bacterium]|nr:MAG: ribosomal RNA small subunit methyltransferase H [bacterium]
MTWRYCNGEFSHEPVLLEEALRILDPHPGGIYLDCTVGGGGHAEAILSVGGKNARLIGIDRDKEILRSCRKRLNIFGGNVELHCDRFENIHEVLGGRKVDGILMDLGVSSFMLDDPERGFSFMADGPLDMRMDRSQTLTAGAVVNGYTQKKLAAIFKEYGEERYAARVARRIVKQREEKRITSTLELAELVKSAIPRSGARRIHPATKIFQALRIEVNGELEELESAITAAVDHLSPCSALAVISFHSLEDRIAKRVFARLAKGCVCPPGLPVCICHIKPKVRKLSGKPIRPRHTEMEKNPRARSAKLRAVERTSRSEESFA